MTRSSESRSQRASRRGSNNNAESKNDDPQDEREQKNERSRHRRRSSSSRRSNERRSRGGGEGDVLFQFSKLLQQGAPHPGGNGSGIRIDLQKASNVLEAAAGNMGLAANLYWDDYFATQAANPAPEPEPPGEEKRGQEKEADQGFDWDDADPGAFREEYFDRPKRRLRRSLDSDFQAADDDDETKKKKRAKRAIKSLDASENNDDDEGEEAQKLPAIKRNGNPDEEVDARPPSRRRSHRRKQQMYGDSDSNDEEEKEDETKNKRRRRPRNPYRFKRQPVVEGEMVVSDDEFGRGGPKGGKPPARRRDKKSKKEDAVSKSAVLKAVEDIHSNLDRKGILSKTSTWFLSPEQKRKRQAQDDDDASVASTSEDYICDEDWLQTEPYQIAMEYVWGAAHDYYTIDPKDNDDKSDGVAAANVVADDDAMNVSGEDEDGVDNDNKPAFKSVPLLIEGPEFRGIPYTWLSTGFQLSECGTGLAIKSPTVEDVEFFTWRQTQVNDKRNAVPPPYHCKSLTAITSIVTGLLHTGASIQGNEVNFTSGKSPWSSLTLEDRKREFDSRLTDALSSLIFVAAQASLKRKKLAYKKAMRMVEATDDEANYSELLRKAIAARKGPLARMLDGNDEPMEGGKENDDVSGNTESAVVEDNPPKNVKRRLVQALNQDDILDPAYKEHVSMLMDKQKRELKERMRRRLELIPTCVWADKKEVVKPRSGDGGCFFGVDTKVKISWTNIRDIKMYVQSNLRAFTGKAGIALFLETLLRIHGDKYIGAQLKRCEAVTSSVSVTGKRTEEKDAHLIPEIGKGGEVICKSKPFSVYAAGFPSLIRCTCEDRQRRQHEENPLPLNVRVDPTKLLDMTPSGTECVSVELLTLILTGRVSSDWKDCSSETLGIGVLTDTVGEVSHGLARPQKPVWLIKGPTCYSVLYIDGSWRNSSAKENYYGDDIKTISRMDKPNASLNLCHWNGWYGQRGKTEMRLVTSKSTTEVPSKKLLAEFSELPKGTNTKTLLLQRRRYEKAINVVSAEEHKSSESKGKESLILPGELDRIQIHEQDQKLYPNNHKMWSFHLADDSDEDKKPAAKKWRPYFQLTARQKRLVEAKLGPKINTILWTRWPDATVDHFVPSEGGFPVV